MFCGECGAEIREGAKFCKRCGAPASASESLAVESKTETRSGGATSPPMSASRIDSAAQASVQAQPSVRISQSKRTSYILIPAVVLVVILVGAGFFVYFHRSNQGPSDTSIAQNIRAAFYSDTDLRKCPMDVTARQGIVTLAGFVSSDAEKTSAVKIASKQQGVKQVIDQLVVSATIITQHSYPVPPKTVRQPSVGSLSRSIEVPGAQPWTATGIALNAGDVVNIAASGGVSFSMGSKPEPPAGELPNCLTVANGPYGWRAAPYVANQLPCGSLLGRIGENGVVFYIGRGTSFTAATSGQLYLGVNDNNFSDNSGHWTATVTLKTSSASAGTAQMIWLGFANGNVAQDRDAELRQNCGNFKRIYVPESLGNKFSDLCTSVGKTCGRVCDWNGNTLPCDAVSLGGARDGTRVALCR